jgi:hypothetical protein
MDKRNAISFGPGALVYQCLSVVNSLAEREVEKLPHARSLQCAGRVRCQFHPNEADIIGKAGSDGELADFFEQFVKQLGRRGSHEPMHRTMQ